MEPAASDRLEAALEYGDRPVDAFLVGERLTTRERMNRERRWVGWQIEMRGGAPTKVPVNPATGQLAKSNEPSTWATLAEAEEAAQQYGLEGVGFLLGAGRAGIDIDGPPEWKANPPRDEAEAYERKKATLERVFGDRTVAEWVALIGGYVEFSPNLGLKVIVHSFFSEERDEHKNGEGLEVYYDGRYFTVTADAYLDYAEADLAAFRELAACRPPRGRSSSSTPVARTIGTSTAYGSRALEAEATELLRTPEGGRNSQLNISAYKLGQLIAGSEVDEGEALQALERAALGTGLGPDEIRRTLERALDDGKAQPRTAPQRTAPPQTKGAGVQVDAEQQNTVPEIVWTEPVSFPADNIEAAVSFPSHVLPGVARDVVTAVSRFVQVDESLVAQNVLGIGSFLIARKVVVVEGHWWEEGNLWTIAAADSGERKSAALRRVIRVVREVERERRADERQTIASEGADLELLEQQYATAVKKAAKPESEVERIASETEVRELARRVSEAKGGLTRETRLIVDDVTPEYFGRELADNNPLLFASAEGGLLDNFINRYTNIPNLDLLNSSYSGDDYSPGRATRNAEPVERPLSCFALSPQPIVVAALTTNEILIHRGTLSRFLYWFVPRLAGTRAVETQALDLAAVEAWNQRIRELLSLPDPGADPYQVRIGDEAVKVMLRYRQRVEDALRSAEGPGMRAWLNRARGHAQRLALVLHFLAHGVDGVAKEIAGEHAAAAVELMTAYQEHAMIAFDLMNEAPLLKRSRTMLGWLRERNAAGAELSVREAHRSHQRWGSVKECRDVLAELHGRGWIWMESREASSFLVHPDLHKSSDRDDR